MKSLKPVLSRVNQIAQRAQTAATELSPAALVAILQQGRQNARLGIRPKLQTDEELRAGVRTRAGAVLIERLIARRRRYEEYLRTRGLEARSSTEAGASPQNSR